MIVITILSGPTKYKHLHHGYLLSLPLIEIGQRARAILSKVVAVLSKLRPELEHIFLVIIFHYDYKFYVTNFVLFYFLCFFI